MKEKLFLASRMGYADMEIDAWILSESMYDLCDFIGQGAFPGFCKKVDAEAFCALANEYFFEDANNHFVQEVTHRSSMQMRTNTYWTVD